jgi:hypothetical protein
MWRRSLEWLARASRMNTVPCLCNLPGIGTRALGLTISVSNTPCTSRPTRLKDPHIAGRLELHTAYAYGSGSPASPNNLQVPTSDHVVLFSITVRLAKCPSAMSRKKPTVEDENLETAEDKRRMQNRKAQRRFRAKYVRRTDFVAVVKRLLTVTKAETGEELNRSTVGHYYGRWNGRGVPTRSWASR